MNIFLGGNPLNQKEDTTAIYTLPCSIPPLLDYRSTPIETMLDGKTIWAEKNLAQI